MGHGRHLKNLPSKDYDMHGWRASTQAHTLADSQAGCTRAIGIMLEICFTLVEKPVELPSTQEGSNSQGITLLPGQPSSKSPMVKKSKSKWLCVRQSFLKTTQGDLTDCRHAISHLVQHVFMGSCTSQPRRTKKQNLFHVVSWIWPHRAHCSRL